MLRSPYPVLLAVFGLVVLSELEAAPPRSLDDRLTIELVAEHPTLVTPTGIDVDGQGRAWVIESNTHFPPEGYDRHPSDRLLIFSNAEGDDGKSPKVFADGFTHAMSVAVRPAWIDPVQPWSKDEKAADAKPAHTQVFLATRREILLLEDLDGDDVCDKQTRLAWLETEGNYPHNGLAGFAFDAMGWMYFGFGENLGADYTLYSRETSVESPEKDNDTPGSGPSTLNSPLKGGGEGGNMYRMWPDGSHLSHWATGFWNPHASCVDAFGRLFTVDNDPDSRPPCRLLHVIEGGDYGYRFRNGRKGLHPFTSWNGEIPGTLPMVSGTGEAPSGILAYEHDAFPEEYLGNLIVTSWGDHRIDRFRLQPKGASFESVPEPLIIGDENFRPVGIALAPDGSLYCTDWVQRDYKVHGQGRLWRIRSKEMPKPREQQLTDRELLESKYIVERRLAGQRFVAKQGTLILLDDDSGLSERAKGAVAAAGVRGAALNNGGYANSDAGGRKIIADAIAAAKVNVSLSEIQNGEITGKYDRFLFRLLGAELAPANQVQGRVMSTWKFVLSSNDPFVDAMFLHSDLFKMAIPRVDSDFQKLSQNQLPDWNPRDAERLMILSTQLARRAQPQRREILDLSLRTSSPIVRQLAVQWAAEEHLTDLRPQVEAVLKSEPMTTSLFLSTLAALEMLDGKAPKDFDQTPPGKYVLPLLKEASTPDAVKVQALRLVDPRDPGLTIALLQSLLKSSDQSLRLEVLHTLGGSALPEAASALSDMARSMESDNSAERLAAINELSAHLEQPVAREALLELLNGPLEVRGAVIRSLRELAGRDAEVKTRILESVATRSGDAKAWSEIDAQLMLIPGDAATPNASDRPGDDEHWMTVLGSANDAADSGLSTLDARLAGEQVFYHPNGPGCFKCHTVNGRGGRIGPDLSRIGGALSREQLLTAILKPSQDVSPQFTNWTMALTDGRLVTGMLVHENSGESTLGNDKGELTTVKTANIEARTPVRTSVMPEKLEERMTVVEFHELLEFLSNLK